MGKPKEKPKSALLPKQAAHMMKEKYVKELNQQPKGTEGEAQQAPDQVEHAGCWAADELAGRAVEQGREYVKKKFAAAHGKEDQAGTDVISYGDNPSVDDVPRSQPVPEYPSAIPPSQTSAEYSAAVPKERSLTEHFIATPKERPAMEVPITAPKGRPLTERVTFSKDRPLTERMAAMPKERPQARPASVPIKDRKAMECRAASKEEPLRSPEVQTKKGAQTLPNDSAYPLRERPTAQGFRQRPTMGVPKTAAKSTTKNITTPDRPRTAISSKQRQTTLKERPRLSLRDRPAPSAPAGAGNAPRSMKKPLSPKLRRGTIKPTGKSAVRPAAPAARAAKAAQSQMQRRMLTQTKQAAKGTARMFRRAIQAVAKAAAAVTGAVSGLVGGCVLLVALVIIIVIAAVANSPFGLFFAEEPNAPDTVSVSQAVGAVNVAYNAELERLQTGNYSSIDIQGAAPDWPEVLAVFAVKVAGAEVDGKSSPVLGG